MKTKIKKMGRQHNVRIIETKSGLFLGYVSTLGKPRKTKDGIVQTWLGGGRKRMIQLLNRHDIKLVD